MRNVPTTTTRERARRWSMLVNSLVVMAGYILSRLLGMARDVVIANRFGTTDAADAYTAAFAVPDFLYLVIIGGALGSAFIPVFSELLGQQGKDAAWRLASQVMNMALIVLLGVSGVVLIGAEPLVALIYHGYDPVQQALVVDLLRIFLLSPLLLGLGGLAMAVLNAQDSYTLPALAPSIYNLSIIGGALFLAPSLGIFGVAWGVVIGALLYLAIQIPGLLRLGMRYTPTLGLYDASLRKVAKLMGPRVFGQGAMQLNNIVTASIASTLTQGSVRALGMAYQLMLLPHGIFALSLGTVAFPAMTRAYLAGGLAEVGQTMRSIVRTVLWTVVPAAVALALLAVPIVRLLFQHGEFDETSTQLVSSALLLYASALPAFAASEILIRSFYATQNTRIPVGVGLVTVALNIAVAWLFVVGLGYGHVALAGAFSLANNVEALLLAWLLHRRIGLLDPAGDVRHSLRRTVLAAAGMGLVLFAFVELSARALPWLRVGQGIYEESDHLPLLVVWLIGAGLLGLGVYVGLSALQGSEEMRFVAGKLLGRLRRRREE